MCLCQSVFLQHVSSIYWVGVSFPRGPSPNGWQKRCTPLIFTWIRVLGPFRLSLLFGGKTITFPGLTKHLLCEVRWHINRLCCGEAGWRTFSHYRWFSRMLPNTCSWNSWACKMCPLCSETSGHTLCFLTTALLLCFSIIKLLVKIILFLQNWFFPVNPP